MSFTTAAALILIAAGLIAGWALSLLAHPIGNCPRCTGRRVHRQLLTNRIVACRVCDGTGLWRRIGATFVHRTYWSIRDDTRRRDHLTAIEERGTRPQPQPPRTEAPTEPTHHTENTHPERQQP